MAKPTRSILLSTTLVAALLTACGGGDSSDDSAAEQTTTTQSVEQTTTTAFELTLADEGFNEACQFRAIDFIVGQTSGSVSSMIQWLNKSESAEMHDLADQMANGNAAGVDAAVSELTGRCAQAGFDFPEP